MPLDTVGSHRDAIDLAVIERDRLISRNVLVGDPRRWRPRWFDGRFLAASDLKAEQSYFLSRQAELGRAGGSGVVAGLNVSEAIQAGTGAELLRIEAGFGFSDTGELISLFDPIEVNPANIPEMQRLDGAFGLQVIPNPTGIARTGLFIVALRPVEWSANPIGAYPTSLTGTRTAEDGTIVEGVAVSLIPYPDSGNDESWNRRRARVAREIFVHGRDYGIDSGVLPLAMVAFTGSLIEWVDPFMVRRETGSERPAGMDFGFGNRSLREAHLLQYQQHLAAALTATQGSAFGASTWFDTLPPVGQFPSSCVDPDQLTQRFFPPGVETELAFMPEDELPALIEESLLVPPIDLTLSSEELAGTGVIIIVPLPRSEFATRAASLPNWDAALPRLRPAFANLQPSATPLEMLMSRVRRPVPLESTTPEAAWREFLRAAIRPADGAAQRTLWYVRRRYLPIPVNVHPTAVDATSVVLINRSGLADVLSTNPIAATNFNRLRGLGSPGVNALLGTLAETRVLENPAALNSVLSNAGDSIRGTPTQPGTRGRTRASIGGGDAPTRSSAASIAKAIAALAPLADPQFGTGLRRLRVADPELAERLESAPSIPTESLAALEDLAREVPDDRLQALARDLKKNLPKAGARATGRAKAIDWAATLADLRQRFIS